MAGPVHNLYQLLEKAAIDNGDRGITIYQPGHTDGDGQFISYCDLLKRATSNARSLQQFKVRSGDRNVLLHFNNHLENIVWFWSVVVTGMVPVISTPFAHDAEQRKKHIAHLNEVLKRPLCITSDSLLDEFSGHDYLEIHTAEDILSNGPPSPVSSSDASYDSDEDLVEEAALKDKEELAALMLTSGSSGNAKAVCLRHGQVITAVKGKSHHHGTKSDDTFLNWIGFDHVANLTEIHLHAMRLGANQIQVQAADVSEPTVFLDLLSKHKVNYTFAPNFYLAKLRKSLENSDQPLWDLVCLRALISGGEANVVETCAALTGQLQTHGAPDDVIRPGFGMTETCAGSIYSRDCPKHDIENNNEFASLGSCIPGLAMRVRTDDGDIAEKGIPGNLEVTGPAVVKEYYNNPSATADSFTDDGWFVTGDRALIDSSGQLNLAGRKKETIIVNGVKYFPHEIETALEEASITGMTPGYTVVFPHRPKDSQTEMVCVIYLPTFDNDITREQMSEDIELRGQVADEISKLVLLQSASRPYTVLPLDASLLQKSSLGKLSRFKIKTAFEQGHYAAYQTRNDDLVSAYRAAHYEPPSTATEASILDLFSTLFDIPSHEVSVSSAIVELGVSSIEILRLKQELEHSLSLPVEIPVILIMTSPTIRAFASAIDTLRTRTTSQIQPYNPTVVLQSRGTKTPLWVVHPGVGEILVFLPLAKYLSDRPIYALRARGFNPGETLFGSIPDAVSIYHTAIKAQQPTGPYAIAGYSYGGMLAFEVAKRLENEGDTVAFTGSFNLPPHIKTRMRQLDWTEVVLNLSYFLDLFSEDYAHSISEEMHTLSRDQVLVHIMATAAAARLKELDLTTQKLKQWADLAHGLHEIAHDYDPSGSVSCMDVFYAIPLQAVAKNKEDWVKNKLSLWRDFVKGEVRFHEAEGAHYTMMGPQYVRSFQKTLKAALSERGI